MYLIQGSHPSPLILVLLHFPIFVLGTVCGQLACTLYIPATVYSSHYELELSKSSCFSYESRYGPNEHRRPTIKFNLHRQHSHEHRSKGLIAGMAGPPRDRSCCNDATVQGA
ncbi:hypothetical protein GGS20DRAFT_518749 [Poronia punctata]|nr:hypothetical protein GGS20DRAFT_518749 [Poronia punctata]